MENNKKEFEIKKISDQKDGFKGKYSYIRDLSVGEDNLPLNGELTNLVNLELGKNVALLIGDNNISLISYKSEYKFLKKVKKEYKKNWDEESLKGAVADTFWKNVTILKEQIPAIEMIKKDDLNSKKR